MKLNFNVCDCFFEGIKRLAAVLGYEISDDGITVLAQKGEKVLLAREEQTFEFLDELISTASSAFRSNRIHIGMDEAWDMGRGAFLTKHGYVAPIDIFTEFMERLTKITDSTDFVLCSGRICTSAQATIKTDTTVKI